MALVRSQEHLIFTLDDPYIHLAVAENTLRGTYGINLDQFSPSSSVIYPFVLALAEVFGFGEVGALLISVMAAGLSVWLPLDFFWSRAVPADERISVFPFVVSLLLVFLISALALPMTGMCDDAGEVEGKRRRQIPDAQAEPARLRGASLLVRARATGRSRR